GRGQANHSRQAPAEESGAVSEMSRFPTEQTRRPFMSFARFVAVLALVVVSSRAWGQPLVDRVPGDALIYVGWSGSQNLGPAYDASHLKAVAASSDVQKIFTETIPAIARRAGRGNAEVAEAMNLVSAVGGRVWRHPTAFYWRGFDFTGKKP